MSLGLGSTLPVFKGLLCLLQGHLKSALAHTSSRSSLLLENVARKFRLLQTLPRTTKSPSLNGLSVLLVPCNVTFPTNVIHSLLNGQRFVGVHVRRYSAWIKTLSGVPLPSGKLPVRTL